MARLNLYFFGPPRVVLDGQPVAADRRKALALLAYLAVPGPGLAVGGTAAHTRQALATLLWPDYPADSALAYLRRALWELNQAIGSGWISAERDTVRLRPTPELWIDVARFQVCLAACRGAGLACAACLPLLEEAAVLYTADFLAGFSLKDAPGFDEWTLLQAESLRQAAAQVFEHYAGCLAAAGQPSAAVNQAQRRLALDQLNEAAHRQLMELYAQAGQVGAALRQYQACVSVLQAELGLAPQPETTALYERLRAGLAAAPSALASAPPAPTPQVAPAPARQLLAYANAFVGRETELAEIARLLADPACRLLTLTGPGGVGKTRLAVQAAENQRPAFANGVFFVPLVAVPEAQLVVPALAGALGFNFFGNAARPDEQKQQLQLVDFLREKHLLLVLDNFEHLLPQPAAVNVLADLLAAAPGVKLLATSRERLNLQNEWVLSLSGLRAANGSGPPALQAGDSAVRLFEQAARKAGAGFSLAEADLPAVERIVALVDGLPLGIELAAAWTKVLSCAEIAEEIGRSLDFLATPLRDVPARHKSLRAVFDYSWHLLPDFEQEPLRCLTVFTGSFQREAAQVVAGAGLPALASLVDKSLLYRRAAGRYELHDLVKQYAGEKLAPAETAQTRDRHGRYYADFVAVHNARLRGHGQREALDALAGELENIRAGLHRALERRDVALLERYLGGLFWFYEMTSRSQEGYDLIGQVKAQFTLDAAGGADTQRLAALLLVWHGQLAGRLSRVPEAVAELYEGMMSLQRQGPGAREAAVEGAVIGLQWVGFGVFRDTDEGRRLASETLTYLRTQGNRWGEAQILWVEAWTTTRANEDLEPYYRRSLEIQRDIGDRHRAARTLNWLGEYYHHIGEYAAARRCYEESLDIARDFGDHWTASLSHDYSGYVARRMGDYDLARAHHAESLRLSREIGDRLGQAGSLDNLGLVALELGELEEARRLLYTALEMRRAAGDAWSLAISLGHIADLSLAASDPQATSGPALDEAEAALAEALALAPYWPATRISLAALRLRQGRLPQAEVEAHSVLRTTLESNDLPLATRALSGLASLHVAWGERVRAAEVLGLLVQHPATEFDVRQAARRQLEALSRQLPPQVMLAAVGRGQAAAISDLVPAHFSPQAR
jgi:predicted ATPase/DNA-binding SARP family transcriptional activator